MRISDWSSDVCSSDLVRRNTCFGHGCRIRAKQVLAANYREHGRIYDYRRKCPPAEMRRHVGRIPPESMRHHQHRGSGKRSQHAAYGNVDDRKSVVKGKRVSERVVFGGGRILKKKK